MSDSLVWVVPELRGGIHSYAKALWPAVRDACAQSGIRTREPIYVNQQELPGAIDQLREIEPSLVHVQHEFGLFGMKIPPFYKFPAWVQRLRQTLPGVRVCATAHTVLSKDYRYDWRGRGLRGLGMWLANSTVVPPARKRWIQGTWGALEGTVVHSSLQLETVRESGCKEVVEIPHFVPAAEPRRVSRSVHPGLAGIPSDRPVVMVFGFISPEKGQELAIRAVSGTMSRALLIIAGGSRRKEDEPYIQRCKTLISELGMADRVRFTGFLADDQIDEFYARATVVLAPFRETSGSGSLAQALSRSAPILASDLPLNREIQDRVPGALALYRSGDAADCAAQLDRLIREPGTRQALSQAAGQYARAYDPAEIARRHLDFYRRLGIGPRG